jgi:hypothetical protein
MANPDFDPSKSPKFSGEKKSLLILIGIGIVLGLIIIGSMLATTIR